MPRPMIAVPWSLSLNCRSYAANRRDLCSEISGAPTWSSHYGLIARMMRPTEPDRTAGCRSLDPPEAGTRGHGAPPKRVTMHSSTWHFEIQAECGTDVVGFERGSRRTTGYLALSRAPTRETQNLSHCSIHREGLVAPRKPDRGEHDDVGCR